ncbi:unnamed protein product [Spirodela intermedia]|uniref:Activator of Hsp90 ATPase AHSA1-like N-terminal domain-containing protein n=1 Tax=Spirodela intermedia TaxID=51605 RepID=A0A7I8J369_SPIIN|nr:unnamed protein product [Spirodela intermedia]CAA6664253.1 unnamed protein product [Spirodela intermedia]
MAKFGEGDKRWIVADRADGTNVHNWHWRSATAWSGGLVIRTQNLEKLEGEAYVNIRKGKVIPGYELSLSLSWEGEAISDSAAAAAGGGAASPPLLKVQGSVEVPYLADENADEDPEVRVTVRGGDNGPLERRIKEAFLAKGSRWSWRRLGRSCRAWLRAAPPRKSSRRRSPSPRRRSSRRRRGLCAGEEGPSGGAGGEEEAAQGQGGIQDDITDRKVLLPGEQHLRDLDGREPQGDRRAVQPLRRLDHGVNEDLQEGKLIVQKWRFGSWADGVHSTVRMTLDEPETGVTIVKLTQTNVPVEDRYGNATVVENTERGWRELIFHKIRAVFGFGV